MTARYLKTDYIVFFHNPVEHSVHPTLCAISVIASASQLPRGAIHHADRTAKKHHHGRWEGSETIRVQLFEGRSRYGNWCHWQEGWEQLRYGVPRLSSSNDHVLTCRVVRKLDFYLLPFLSVMYFFNRQVHFLGTHLCSIQLVDSTKVLTVRTWEMRKRMVWTKILALPANSIACWSCCSTSQTDCAIFRLICWRRSGVVGSCFHPVSRYPRVPAPSAK